MTLADLMKRHMRGVMSSPEHFGEPEAQAATYAFADGSPARQVRVVVQRRLIEQSADGVAQVAQNTARVCIPNDETTGVTEVQKGDRLTLQLRLAGPMVTCRVSEIVYEDEGAWTVLVHA